ncbi:MAG: NAD(P)-binding domain-containing protein, partial [Actinomycetota bacterium]
MSRLAVLGGGKMGEALVAGLLTTGWRKPEDVVVTARRSERLD